MSASYSPGKGSALHDDGGVSSSSEDRSRVRDAPSGQRRRVAGTRGGAASASTAATPTGDREQHLTELLAKASEAIRRERDRCIALEAENSKLHQQVASLQASVAVGVGGGPQTLLRQKLHDLALDHFVALEEVARLRQRVEHLESERNRGGHPQHATEVLISPLSSPNTSRRRRPTTTTTNSPRRANSAQPSVDLGVRRAVVTVVQSPPRRTVSPIKSSSRASTPTNHARTLQTDHNGVAHLPPPSHHFDAMRSVHLAHHAPTTSSGSSSPSKRALTTITTVAQAVRSGMDPEHNTPPMRNYNDVMIHRLRRALAPQPSKEQLGEVVHAMVLELLKELRRRGANLIAKKTDHCVYTINDKKKVNLTIDSGRLVVKAGGGHVDFLEYLERNKLCVKFQPE